MNILVGKIIRNLRLRIGITQEELAKKAGMSRRGIDSLERRRGLILYSFNAILRGLGFNVKINLIPANKKFSNLAADFSCRLDKDCKFLMKKNTGRKNKINIHVRKIIRNLRLRIGITQRELAKRAGMSRNSTYLLERRKGSLQLYSFNAVLRALGFNVKINLIPVNKKFSNLAAAFSCRLDKDCKFLIENKHTKEVPTYNEIENEVKKNTGKLIRSNWIAEVRRHYGLTLWKAWSSGKGKKGVSPCPKWAWRAIEKVLRKYSFIS